MTSPSRRLRRPVPCLPATVLAFLLLAPTLCAQWGGPTLVEVTPAGRERVHPTLKLTGLAVAIRSTTLASAQDGIVKERKVFFGVSYAADAPLLVLDSRKAEARRDAARAAAAAAEARYRELANGTRKEDIAVARAELERTRAARVEAEQHLRRYQDLFKSSATAQNELDAAVRAADVAKAEEAASRARLALLEAGARTEQVAASRAQWEAARAELAVAERELDEMTLRAPFACVADEVKVEVGGWVKVGDPLTRLLDISWIDTVVLVPENRIRQVPLGAEATVRFPQLDPPVTITAKVASIGSLATAAGKTYPVVIRFENTERRILAGMSAEVDLPVGEAAERLVIPKDAVVRAPGMPPKVFVAVDGKAQVRMVKLGVDSASRVEVLEGISEGESVVVRGNERLRPDAAVTTGGPPAAPGGDKPRPEAGR